MINYILSYAYEQPLKFGALLGLVVVLLGISYYIYRWYSGDPSSSKQYVPNDEYDLTGGNENKEAELIMFYTTWCPYCKKSRPVWEQIRTEFDGNTINNVRLVCKDIDRDENKELAEEYNVKGVPTIILVKPNGEQVLYDAKPDYDNLVEFLHTSLK